MVSTKSYEFLKHPARGKVGFPVCGRVFGVNRLADWYLEFDGLVEFCRRNCDVDPDKCVDLMKYFEKYWRISAGYEDKHHVPMPHIFMIRHGHWHCP